MNPNQNDYVQKVFDALVKEAKINSLSAKVKQETTKFTSDTPSLETEKILGLAGDQSNQEE